MERVRKRELDISLTISLPLSLKIEIYRIKNIFIFESKI
jgi:hypothetical protein